jgi:hypothetical protein
MNQFESNELIVVMVNELIIFKCIIAGTQWQYILDTI